MSGEIRNHRSLQNLSVKTNMCLDPPKVASSDPVSAILEEMIEEDVGAVIVQDEEQLVGIVTEKNLLERVIKPERDIEKTLVKEIMSQPLISIESDRTIKDALDIMTEKKIRRLVITEKNILLGLTTERRLLEVSLGRFQVKNFSSIYDSSSYLTEIKVGFVSTFPPRECGIATFTKDLLDAVTGLYIMKPSGVLAINDRGGYYSYSDEVEFQVSREEVESYVDAANKINESEIDIVNLQHEFGLFGGVWGENVITFLEHLEKPVVTTLHTLHEKPPQDAKRVMKKIIEHSDYLTVMARIGIQILEQLYDTLPYKVRYIPHGCPNVPFIRSETVKKRIGLKNRIVLSTFGLLSRGKGIEYAIQALPPVIKEEPRITYLVIGETHPEIRKNEGEEYRKYLLELVESLGIERNVRFVNKFLPKNDLIKYLQATDLYLIPYPNKEQISSGTLLYALSTGKAIVSTPFLHAKEIIDEGCAMETEFKNPDSMGDQILNLVKQGDIRRSLEEKAYRYSRNMIWPNVAMRYINLFYHTLGM